MSAPAWAMIGAAAGATLALVAMLLYRRQARASGAARAPTTDDRAASISHPSQLIDPDRTTLWYYAQNGTTLGPYSFDQLQVMFHEGHLAPEDYVCCQKDKKWVEARQVKHLVPENA